ncbi:MAG: AmmeMemoRadiSam system protein B [Deltaproteobacteria bacterium]|nr:AmmeMemoRadiSam system protein B [Deltaproteobacteria bacterium]
MLRPSFLAGLWYPATDSACRKAIAAHAADAEPEQGPYTGLVGPHAGWSYSGDAAAEGYAWLSAAVPHPDLVVVFGSHRGPHGPNTIFCADGWSTPLGPLATARDLAIRLRDELRLGEEPVQPGHPDNAVELHLPFVRYFFPKAELLMLGVGAAKEALAIGAAVAKRVQETKRRAVFIGSTDLTHYGPNYDFEPQGRGDQAVRWVREQNDRGFIDAILAKEPETVVLHGTEEHSACCPGAVAAAMSAVQAASGALHPKVVSHYLSYDVQPNDSFVGYAGVLL